MRRSSRPIVPCNTLLSIMLYCPTLPGTTTLRATEANDANPQDARDPRPSTLNPQPDRRTYHTYTHTRGAVPWGFHSTLDVATEDAYGFDSVDGTGGPV